MPRCFEFKFDIGFKDKILKEWVDKLADAVCEKLRSSNDPAIKLMCRSCSHNKEGE